MKLSLWLSFFALVISNQSLSQSDASPIKAVSRCVAFLSDSKIETTSLDGKIFEMWLRDPLSGLEKPKMYSNSGTGFFIRDVYSIYLVTAEHVAKDLTLATDVVINGKSDVPVIYKLKDIVFNKDRIQWTTNDHADVAILLLDYNSEIFQKSFLSFLDPSIITGDVPVREREITTIGFPLGLGFKNYFSPISKISRPSSGLLELNDNNRNNVFFLLDDPSISGFSGSPVFELPGVVTVGAGQIFDNNYKLVGLVKGSLSDRAGGGFTAIVPSIFIVETLNKSPRYSGLVKWIHDNQKPWSERLIKDGKEWTVLNNFDKNGNPVEKGTLTNGNGTLFLYDESGKLTSIEHYSNGVLTQSEKK